MVWIKCNINGNETQAALYGGGGDERGDLREG